MSEYIEREEVLFHIIHPHNLRLEDVIKRIPAADVAQVVRCKDCAFQKKVEVGRYCMAWGALNGMGDDGFCNYGQRREDDGN